MNQRLCFLALVALVAASASLFGPAWAEELGQAHDFKLRTADGKRLQLSEQLKQGPVILDFWATWCGPCKVALPRWNEIAERYAEHGVTLLAISQDDPRSQPKILPYLRSQGFDFAVPLDADKQVGRRYRVMNVPTTFLVASDGRIVTHHVGYREGDEVEFEAALRQLLELPAQERPESE